MNHGNTCTCTSNAADPAQNEAKEDCDRSKKRLENWEKWIQLRRNIHKELQCKLHKRPGDLVMNLGDDLKYINEEKEIHRILNMNTHTDKWRGCPTFYRLPDSLSITSAEPKKTKKYFAVVTKEQKRIVPCIEYVTVPNYLKREKDIVPQTRKPLRILWENLTYRQNKVIRLEKKLNRIQPHKPQLEDLLIVGKGYKQPEIIEVEEPIETEKSVVIDSTSQPSCIERVCYSLNGLKCATQTSEDINIELKFKVPRSSKELHTEHITIENHGKTALRFSFSKVEKFKLFTDIHIIDSKVVFHFNKNTFIVLPGRKVEFPIWVKYYIDGTYHETWKITTDPELISENNVYLLLKYETYVKNFDDLSVEINAMLDVRTKYRIVNDIVNDLTEITKYRKTKITTYNYSEEQIFQSINYDTNLNYGGVRYIYDKDVVGELKEFYEYAKQDKDPEWNLSINELKRITRIRDLLCYEEKMKQLKEVTQMKNEELRLKRREDFLRKMAKSDSLENMKGKGKGTDKQPNKKVVETDNKINKKTKSMERVRTQSKLLLETSNFFELNKILRKLKRPDMIINNEREKYFQAFSVFRTCILKMCLYLYDYEKSIEAISCPNYSSYYCRSRLYQAPERLTFEKFDTTFKFKNPCNLPITRLKDKPKPEYLAEFDIDDVENIYNTYFIKNDNADRSPHKEKSFSLDKEKLNSLDKEKSISPDKYFASKQKQTDFDPYGEVFMPTYPDAKSDEEEDDDDVRSMSSYGSSVFALNKSLSYKDLKSYSLNLYIIIYTHLKEGIDAVLEIVDSYENYTVPELLLHEIKQEERIITSAEYANLLDKQVKLPKGKIDLFFDESVQNYLIKGITKPTRSDESTSSLWSIYKCYTPVTSTSSIHVQTPEDTSTTEVHIRDAHIQTCAPSSLQLPQISDSQYSLPESSYEVLTEEATNTITNLNNDTNEEDEYYYSDDENFHLSPNVKSKQEQ